MMQLGTEVVAGTVPRAGVITVEAITRLVHTFYDRVLTDPDLGPIFHEALSHRWDDHLATMVRFWSSVVLRTGGYSGKPHQAHMALGLTPGLFARWLSLFSDTADSVLEPEAAALFVTRAEQIAESLQLGLGIGAKALRMPTRAAAAP
jgi:hemoglobin